jgi:hypothetical protein
MMASCINVERLNVMLYSMILGLYPSKNFCVTLIMLSDWFWFSPCILVSFLLFVALSIHLVLINKDNNTKDIVLATFPLLWLSQTFRISIRAF